MKIDDMKKSLKSWKTSAVGVFLLTIAIPMLLRSVADTMDVDPTTVPNWTATLTTLFAGFLGLFARDGDKDEPKDDDANVRM